MATDPYAAIRRLNFQQLQSLPAGLGANDDGAVMSFQGDYGTDWDALGGFQSKYNRARDVGGGRIMATFQNPGMHKYDTLGAYFRVDPATGEYVMEGNPFETREVSSAQQLVHDPADAAFKMGASAAALYGAAYGLGQFLPAEAAAGAGAAAAQPITNAALIESGLGTAGYGASSAGAGGVVGGGLSGVSAAAGPGMTAPAGGFGALGPGGGTVGTSMGAAGGSGLVAPAGTWGSVGMTTGTTSAAGGSLAQQALMRAGTSLAGNIIGGRLQGNAAQDASRIQMRAAGEGQSTIAAMLKPYIDAGVLSTSAEMDLLGLNGPDKQAGALAVLENSPQFSQMVKQGEGAILGNASATGGLRGGNVQAALRDFRPQVLNQLVEQQLNRLGQMSQRGQGAATGGASGIANLQQQSGAAQAGGALARGQERAGYIGALSQALGYYFGATGG